LSHWRNQRYKLNFQYFASIPSKQKILELLFT
jgi:hypothetical protein